MRVVNAAGRLGLLVEGGVMDVETASAGLFAADPAEIYPRWAEFTDWAGAAPAGTPVALDESTLGAPSPRPQQVFAIGLNYVDHALESGMEPAAASLVCFTKFASSITGPHAHITLPPGSVDFETELVVVIGRTGRQVTEAEAWGHVAGLTLGQDLSERELQLRPPSPQFSLGKSFPGFAPMGPELVSIDEFDDPDDIGIGCSLNGQQMQDGRTSNMIFSVPAIIAQLSATLTLLPGDVIFTGTPAGIGWARDPKVLIKPGDELISTADVIGSMRHRFIQA